MWMDGWTYGHDQLTVAFAILRKATKSAITKIENIFFPISSK